MNFLKEFLKNPSKIGAIAASSNNLSKLITKTANLTNKKCVVEFGSGNGVFTKRILQEINSDCTFFSIESNTEFVKETKNKCPNAIIYNDSAENIKKYLAKHNKKNCDCIISSLPWTAFNKKLQNKLLNSTYNSLEEKGVFLTFKYIQSILLPNGKNFEKILKKKFKTIKKTKIVWWNLPPAFIYYCEK